MPKTKSLIPEAAPFLEKKYYSVSELAEMFGVSESKFNKLRVNGKGPKYFKLGQKLVRYAASDILKYIEDGKRQSTSE